MGQAYVNRHQILVESAGQHSNCDRCFIDESHKHVSNEGSAASAGPRRFAAGIKNCWPLKVTGETVSGGLNSYEELHKGEYKWQANSKAIAAVLASPLWLQYKPEAIDYAVNVTLLGLSVACIVVPVAIPAVAGVAIACIALRATSGASHLPSLCLRCA